MAIRYSGDVEVRVSWRDGGYHAHVRAPGLSTSLVVGPWSIGLGPEALLTTPAAARTLVSPEAYDRAAYRAITSVEENRSRPTAGLPVEREGGKIVLRRRFQSPCPILRRELARDLSRRSR